RPRIAGNKWRAARSGSVDELPSFEPAGPRRKIFFRSVEDPAEIMICGGLCPGLNDVIRGPAGSKLGS
ncbi:MAG: hypothetical protein WCB57_16545, partial [Pseudonocardiaceae bacterium]